MADAEEAENELPSRVTTTGDAPADNGVSAALGNIAGAILDVLGVAVNSAPTPPQTVKVAPALEEKVVQGYRAGAPVELTVAKFYGVWAAKSAAYDFLLMRAAAAEEGISLSVNSAFRFKEEQEILYRERMDPATGKVNAVGAVKGPAAKPGFSNHQGGIALDIDVDMSKADRAANNFSAKFLWLQKNAATYGFDNDEVPSEPWHWRHQSDVIVGPQATDTDYLASLVSTASTAEAAASRGGKTDGEVANDQAAHSVASSWARSLEMLRATRASIYANLARSTVFIGGAIRALAAEYAKNGQTLPQSPPTISNDASRAVAFDFKTGKWGDGRSI